nr:odorant receptor 41 [Papilio memnon]
MAGESFLDTALNRLKFILILSGLNLERFNHPQEIKRRLIYIFNFIWLNSDIICSIFYLINGVKNGSDMTDITYLAPCSMLSAISNLKSIYLISYNNYVNNLIDELRFLNIVLNLLNIFNIGMVVNFTFSPLILIAINYFRTKKVELMLPFLDVYPFDPLNIKCWPLVYIKQIWSECIVLLEICAADYFYYICCTAIRIQFRLLRYELENLIPTQQTDDQDIRSKLLKLINWHQHLISVTNTLEFIYSKSTLFNFFSSSVIICLTGFNVTAIDNLAFGVTFLTFLFMSLLQIFFLCLFGDMIMRSSQEVSDAVYNCLWYTVDCRLTKYLMLVQIRAQNPCKLTAMGFADVNLRAFTRVLSSSWSYFCLLNTMYTPSADGI